MHGLIFSDSFLTRNMGAYKIAHVLRNQGWDIEVIDFFRFWKKDELVTLLKQRVNKNTKFIGYGALFYDPANVPTFFFNMIKKQWPELVTIFGTQSNTIIDNRNINYAISGWAENAIVALLKYLFSNGDRPIMTEKGFTKKIDANIHYPDYPTKTLSVEYQDRDFIQPYETLATEFSRGCKFKCKFCNFPVLGVKGDYTRSAEDFSYEIKKVYDQFGVKKFIVADETSNDSTRKIIKFADQVEKFDFTPCFSGFARADLMVRHTEQKEHLLRMNFVNHYYGIESFNYESAKSIGKGMKTEELQKGLIDIKNYFKTHGTGNFRATLSFIIGLPYETVYSLEQTGNWLNNHWRDQAIEPFVMEIPTSSTYKESELSKNYKKYGYRQYSKKITTDKQKQLEEYFHTYSGGASPYDILIWENEYLNVFDSIKINENFQNKKQERPLGNFNLFAHKELDYNRKDDDGYVNELFTVYKEQKLSY